jgi:hypothetical protein
MISAVHAQDSALESPFQVGIELQTRQQTLYGLDA